MSYGMEHRNSCRICGCTDLKTVMHWDRIPFAANVLDAEQVGGEAVFPLDVHYCPACGHVQLLDMIDDSIYQRYAYVPTYVGSLDEYLRSTAKEIAHHFGAKNVVEIGSSTGRLLSYLKEEGCNVLGFESSTQIAAAANENGIPTVCDYFTGESSRQISHYMDKADICIIRHVMEHLDDLDAIMEAFGETLGREGILMIEVPYLESILAQKQFYSFFHEHLSYFSLTTLNTMLNRHDFTMHTVKMSPVGGGSLVVYASRRDGIVPDETVTAMLEAEKSALTLARLEDFAAEIAADIAGIHEFVNKALAEGKTLAAWAEGQRGAMFLNMCGLTPEQISYAIDENPNCTGKFLPGCHIPLVNRQHFLEHPVDGLLVLSIEYLDAMMDDNRDFLAQGGRFVRITPKIEWVK